MADRPPAAAVSLLPPPPTRKRSAVGGQRPAATGSPRSSTRGQSCVASHDPSNMAAVFDLMFELRSNRGQYSGQYALTLYRVPSATRNAIDDVRSHFTTNKPGFGITYVVCLSYGVRMLRRDLTVGRVMTARNRLREIGRSDTISRGRYELITNMVRTLPIVTSTLHATSIKSHPMQLMMNDDLHDDVTDLAEAVGVPLYVMCDMAVAYTLSIQPSLTAAQRAHMTAAVAEIRERFDDQAAIVTALLTTLAVPRRATGDG